MWEQLPLLCWEHIAEYAIGSHWENCQSLDVTMFGLMHCFMVLCHVTRLAALNIFRGRNYGPMRFYRDCIDRLQNKKKYGGECIVKVSDMGIERRKRSRRKTVILEYWFDQIQEFYNTNVKLLVSNTQRLRRLESAVYKQNDSYSFYAHNYHNLELSIKNFMYAVNRLLFWESDRRYNLVNNQTTYTSGFFHLARVICRILTSGTDIPLPLACRIAAKIIKNTQHTSVLAVFCHRLARYIINQRAVLRPRVKDRVPSGTFATAFNWLYAFDKVRSASDIDKFGQWYSGDSTLGKSVMRECVMFANVSSGATLLASYIRKNGFGLSFAKELMQRDITKCSVLNRTTLAVKFQNEVAKDKRITVLQRVYSAVRYSDKPFIKPMYKSRGGAAVKKKYTRLVEGWRLVTGLRSKRYKDMEKIPVADLMCMSDYIAWNTR